MDPVQAILYSLAQAFGNEKVITECRNFIQAPDSEVKRGRGRPRKNASDKPKKERKPRGQTEWNKMVQEVYKEMREKDATFTPKMAFEEAGRRKRASDPEAEAKYQARIALQHKLPILPVSSKTSCADGLSHYESDGSCDA